MRKFYEDLLNKCTIQVLISPFSDIPMNLLEFYKKVASGTGNLPTSSYCKISLLEGLLVEQFL